MAGLIFIIPALIISLIGLIFYAVFGLLFGTFAIMGSAGKVAPKRIGATFIAGAVTTVTAFYVMKSGGSSGSLENGLLFIFALFVGSLAMLVLAFLFSALDSEDSDDIALKDQVIVQAEIEKDIQDGGWGLRKSAYSDLQHAQEQKKRKRERPPPPPPSSINNSW